MPGPDQPYYCVTHREVPWQLPGFMTVVGTGGYRPEGGIALSEVFPDLAYRNAVFGEYAALFAIRRLLEKDGATGFVGTGQYRRFAVAAPVGRPGGIHRIIGPEDFARLPAEVFVADGGTPVVPRTIRFPMTLLEQHARSHVAADLLHFFACAAECGVVDDLEAALFLSGSDLLAMGSVGFVPVEWFVQTMTALEAVTDRFMARHYVARQGDQERCVAWCCERLHGLLLQRRLQAWLPGPVRSEPVVVISDTGRYTPSAA